MYGGEKRHIEFVVTDSWDMTSQVKLSSLGHGWVNAPYLNFSLDKAHPELVCLSREPTKDDSVLHSSNNHSFFMYGKVFVYFLFQQDGIM